MCRRPGAGRRRLLSPTRPAGGGIGVGADIGAEPPADLVARLADFVEFARRRLTGDYEIDEFGFDAELTDNAIMPPLRQLYQKWFRVEVIGAHHLPADTGALIVANHSGTLPLDAMMTAIAVHDNHPGRPFPAHARRRPGVQDAGSRIAGPQDRPDAGVQRRRGTAAARRVTWSACGRRGSRASASRSVTGTSCSGSGSGGFVSAALRTGTPIVPCSIVGAEEIYPKIADLKPLARLLGFPYFPVTPFFPWLGPLGAIPLPSKWYIEFGEPIATDDYGEGAEDDPMLVFNLTDQVRETIQQTLYRLLSQRGNVFLG